MYVTHFSDPGSEYRIRAKVPNYIFSFDFDPLSEGKYEFKCAISNLEIDRDYGFSEDDLLKREICYPHKTTILSYHYDPFICNGMFISPNGRFVLNLDHLEEEGIFVYDNALSRKVSWTTGWNYTGLALVGLYLHATRVSEHQLFKV